MATTREEALATLKALAAPAVILQSYTRKKLPEDLSVHLGPPGEFFLNPDTQEPYTEGRLIPLLDDGNFGLVLLWDPEARLFVQKDIEEPERVVRTFENWQQYLAWVLFEMLESTEDEEAIRRAAKLLEFRHTDGLLELWERSAQMSYEEQDEARDRFIDGLRS